MRYSYALSAAALAVGANAQGAAYGLKPSAATPAGWITSSDQKYMISIVLPSGLTGNQASASPVECQSGSVVFTIQNGELHDEYGRLADVVANRQFQFDGPPAQTGAIYDAGFSIAPNGSLALGDSTIWYQCKTSNYYNIYDQSIAPYCVQVNQQVLPCVSSGGAPAGTSVVTASSAVSATSSSDAPLAEQTDGQPNGQSGVSSVVPVTTTSSSSSTSSAPPTVVSQFSDGQPQASAASNVTVTSAAPSPSTTVHQGGASAFVASGAVAAVGAFAAFFL